MAVKPEQIKARLKVLFPKANLSTKRTDEISARLAKKPADDADEAAIDEVINDYNENGAMTFEEIAKADDKIRTLEANKPTPKPDDKPTPDPDEPAWFKAYREQNDAKLEAMERVKSQETISQKFAKDERLKGIPPFMMKGRTPAKDEDYETAVEELVADWKPFVEKNKLEGFDGSDTPVSGEASETAKGKVKPIDMEMAKKIVS